MIPPKPITNVTDSEVTDQAPDALLHPVRRRITHLERGAIATEYGLLAVLCSITLVGGAALIGPRLVRLFTLPEGVLP